MKAEIRAKLLVQLDELERQCAGEIQRKSAPVNRLTMAKLPTISREKWESLGQAARNPALKLHRQAIIAAD